MQRIDYVMFSKKQNPITLAMMYRGGNHRMSLLFVEGKNDIPVFKMIINKETCKIISCGDKKQVINTVDFFNNKKDDGIIGVVDKDYDEIMCYNNDTVKKNKKGNIIYTDENDMEMQMVSTQAFDKLLYSYADEKLLEEFERKNGVMVFDYIVNICYIIGKVRLKAYNERASIKFNTSDITLCINDSWKFVTKKFISLWCAGSKYDMKRYYSEVENDNNYEFEKKKLCRGHDFSTVFSCVFCGNANGSKGIGNEKGKLLSSQKIEENLRLAYSYDDFCKSNLVKTIKEWQLNNEKWIILKDDV